MERPVRLQSRMLRTYARKGACLRRLSPPAPWLSPPPDRHRLFGSSSAASSSSSGAEDPDFRHGRRALLPPARCRLRLRRKTGRREGAQETRFPPSPSPQHRHVTSRRRRGAPSSLGRRPGLRVQPPLFCSTPQPSPAGHRREPDTTSGPARRQPPRNILAELSSLAPDGSPELFPSTARRSPEGELGVRSQSGEPVPALTAPGAWRAPPAPAPAPCGLSWQSADGYSGPQDSAQGRAGQDESQRLRGGSPERSQNGSTEKSKHQLQPWVVLSSDVVPTWLARRKVNKKLEAWSCEKEDNQPVSPFALSVISERKPASRKVIPRNCGGGTSKKACISGFSSSRWGKQAMRRCIRRKNTKPQWQRTEGSFQEQTRPRGMEKNAPEMSASSLDFSFLNDSQWWARARASLSFHKKKKVAIEERACGSILCTPSSKSHLSGYHKSPFIQTMGYGIWPTSSIILLTPMKPHSVLEEMLTDAEKVYGECQQEGPISFEECIPPNKMKNCVKIGEGVFGEVFQTNSERGTVALKIIPVEGTEKVNGEAQKSFSEILPEIIISKELSLLSQEVENRTVGFIGLYSVHCVQGAYPEHLLKAWDIYHKLKGSENDRPDLFRERQLFVVLEFEFGGSDLENMRMRLSSVGTAKSLLHQVTASLAVAEEELRFEHRDLHWGNILVKKTNLKKLSYTLNGAVYTIPTKGIHVNIIDYTLSRLEKDGLTVFCDISTDKELFQGRGDYQFDIYRQMREENSNKWAEYHPHSNVLWLHYLADKLLTAVHYKTKIATASVAMKGIQKELQKFHREVLNFTSAKDVLLNSSLFH